MSITQLDEHLCSSILKTTGASRIESVQVVQELWSGYGQIFRIALHGTDSSTPNGVIVKRIQPPVDASHPRGWNTTESNQRKLDSYEVESVWYERFAEICQSDCKVPALLAVNKTTIDRWLILEDLNDHYPLRHSSLNKESCLVCLMWLARFHARFLHNDATGLWPVGTYWHLGTRQKEYAAQKDSDLKSAAALLDRSLNECKFQTLVHGDAKVANFCFSTSGRSVAAVDFQYVGKGSGIKDVMYFLGSCLDVQTCLNHEQELLDYYFSQLRLNLPSGEAESVESEWRELYDIAAADFHRFLAGWMPEHTKINRYMALTTARALGKLSGPSS